MAQPQFPAPYDTTDRQDPAKIASYLKQRSFFQLDPPYARPNAIPLDYRVRDWHSSDHPPNSPLFPVFVGYEVYKNLPEGYREYDRDLEPRHIKQWLDADKMELDDWVTGLRNRRRWYGVKVLGTGGGGKVGLWKYDGSFGRGDNPIKEHRQVVIKEVLNYYNSGKSLSVESSANDFFREIGPKHLAISLTPGRKLTKADVVNEGLDASWRVEVRRLIYEYCELGDAWDLISRRRNAVQPFNEVTLWRIFSCLTNAIVEMAPGGVYRDDVSRVWERAPTKPWPVWCHMDIKAENILVKEDSDKARFANTPMFKIADFGNALQIPPGYMQNLYFRQSIRRSGTRGHHLPEQFTEQWDYRNWNTAGVAGVYGVKSNVWHIGHIMFSFAELNPQPDEGVPPSFLPDFPVCEEHPKGSTYNEMLRDIPNYSGEFKDLVWECLYEVPRHRPSLRELKKRVVQGLKAAIAASDGAVEPWENFLPPQPPVEEMEDSDDMDFGSRRRKKRRKKQRARAPARGRRRTPAPPVQPDPAANPNPPVFLNLRDLIRRAANMPTPG
ncbi:kinase-like domain-containing protein [Amylocarpus encephaloides]|uniref:non-specific serine/threonine protein kinase n=1 Tax=Amylocarpus encephaloides TaxID=45428 RepID=A0A9P7YEZ2_9HELO|nr:kinase-like domain-containing protein [Amylocarpus encephaloides]